MPLPFPNLDDRTYADLVAEARALIPGVSEDWTDHNPADPGITLVELFAWLTEMTLYRTNRIPEASYDVFLKLLNGPEWTRRGDLQQAIRESVVRLRERYRAVTAEDYEWLATVRWPRTELAQSLATLPGGAVARTHCLARRDLESPHPRRWEREEAAAMSLIVLPERPDSSAWSEPVMPRKELLEGLWSFLDERRLLTTRHRVVGPEYVNVGVEATIGLTDDADGDAVRAAAVRAIRRYYDPHVGGSAGRGWAFGGEVHVSQVHALLAEIPGVVYVEEVHLSHPEADRIRMVRGSQSSAVVFPHELVTVNVDEASITVKGG